MRLTLRTMLAWLDDTLSAAEARQIGQQVAESTYAQDLKDRIRRVTRQRRLTVPSDSGPDSTDPNLVAAYLDNELEPEKVTEFEKVCLTSDVHLAEVASVHQILSLIGQKAKVPDEARVRMYRLIKGPEAVPTAAPARSEAAEPDLLTEPLAPWSLPEPPRTRRPTGFRTAAAIGALVLVLIGSTWWALSPEPPSREANPSLGQNQPAPAPVPTESPRSAVPSVATAPTPAEPKAPTPTPPVEVAATPTPAPPATEPASEPKAEPKSDRNLPPGAVGQLTKSDGVLLHFNPSSQAWLRLRPPAYLKEDERILCLAPYRIELDMTPARVWLVQDTEVRIHMPARDEAVRFDLIRGRVVVEVADPSLKIAVSLDSERHLLIAPPAGLPIGLERVAARDPASGELIPTFHVVVPEGHLELAVGDADLKSDGPAAIEYRVPETLTKLETPEDFRWITEEAPRPEDQLLGTQLGRFFQDERPILSAIVEATEAENLDVRRLATNALGSIGEFSLLIEQLEGENRPGRQNAIQALRHYIGSGPEAADQVRKALLAFSQGQEEWTQTVMKGLIGLSNQEAQNQETMSQLVTLLQAQDSGLRELAIDQLRELTGRDDLGYDPDIPSGPGVRAWEELLRSNQLRPQAPPNSRASSPTDARSRRSLPPAGSRGAASKPETPTQPAAGSTPGPEPKQGAAAPNPAGGPAGSPR